MSIRFKRFTLMAIATVLATQLGVAADQKPNPLACNRVRLFPAPGREQAMVGGKITGSNTSAREGFEVLAEITSAPAPGQWTELAVPNTKLYRWIRYEAPPGSHGIVAEIEFYAGKRMMIGRTFGSFGWRPWPGDGTLLWRELSLRGNRLVLSKLKSPARTIRFAPWSLLVQSSATGC